MGWGSKKEKIRDRFAVGTAPIIQAGSFVCGNISEITVISTADGILFGIAIGRTGGNRTLAR